MKKDCFSQDFVDAQKFRECASCHLYEECTRTVYLEGAQKADVVGQGLGYALAVGGLAIAFSMWGNLPQGAAWLAFIVLVYALAVYRAGRESKEANRDERDLLVREAEAKPVAAAAPAAHH